jgi:predicted RNase H-like nuclease
VLQRYEPAVEPLLKNVLSSTLRKDVQPDDVLDAAVALVTAESRMGALASLVGIPSHDQAGLSIEMLYLETRSNDWWE